MYNFHLSDFITRFNNCVLGSKKILYLRYSGYILSILYIFKDRGYISKFTYSSRNMLVIINYINTSPIVSRIVLISKPSRRVYKKVKDLTIRSFYNEFYSTNIGILDTNSAINHKTCGECLFKVYTNV
ncbi:30S ribosomal protein S8 [Candidatus Vidania fulgoroideorum]